MLRVLFWLLPVVDVFALPKILKYYKSLGAPVPPDHKRKGMIERWAGYLPVGLVMGFFTGFLVALAAIFLSFVVTAPIELPLMTNGRWVWKFFRGKNPEVVRKIFLLEGYNAIGYYLLGVLFGIFLSWL